MIIKVILIGLLLLMFLGELAPEEKSKEKFKNKDHRKIVDHGWGMRQGRNPDYEYVSYQKENHILYRADDAWVFNWEDQRGNKPLLKIEHPLGDEELVYMDSIIKKHKLES